MILYLDTSALVKAYIIEESSKEVLALINQAEIVASHVFAFVEAHAAFARLKRENKITENEFDDVKNVFAKDWENYLRIENTQGLIQKSADFTEVFALRAYDSVHLAAADMLAKQSKRAVTFACFDRQLNKAAQVIGLLLCASDKA